MFSMFAITTSFCRFLSPDSSASSNTLALRISIAPEVPFRIVFSRDERCSFVSTIRSFLYFVIATMQISLIKDLDVTIY